MKVNMVRRCQYFLLLFMFFLWGCSNNEAGSAQKSSPGVNSDSSNSAKHNPVYNISFTKEISFGSTAERLVVPRENVVTDEKDRVYIPDIKTSVIHVFDSTGQYLTQMSGKGRGPGEYLHFSSFQITSDYLYVYDDDLYKITAYSLEELEYSHTILLNQDGWKDVDRLKKRSIGNDFFVTDDGKILMEFIYRTEFNLKTVETEDLNKNDTIQFYWLNQEGIVTSDMVLEQRGKKRFVIDGWGSNAVTTFGKIFGKPLHTMSDDGVIAAGRSTQFNITIHRSDGGQKNGIKFPFDKTPLKRETLVEDYKSTFDTPGPKLKAYKTMDLPDNWPALKTMFFDDQNRLWVAAIVSDLDVHEWFIFNTDGQLLASFTWPRDKPIQEVNNGFMFTSQKNKKGVRRIVRYNMEMNKMRD